jgi:hypothetical protein
MINEHFGLFILTDRFDGYAHGTVGLPFHDNVYDVREALFHAPL